MRLSPLVLVVLAVSALAGCVEDPLGPQVQDRAEAYLVGHQLPDGGWPATANGTSDFATTCWVVLALAAAGAPADRLDRARDYLDDWADRVQRNGTGSLSQVNPVALYALAGLALGVPDAAWNGTDVLGRLEGFASNDSLVLNEKIFVVGALGRAGRTGAIQDLREELRSKLGAAQGELVTDAWFRSQGILALLASGDRKEDETTRAWARSLLPFQEEESGFRGQMEYEPDASTTASVLTVLTKVRFVYSHERTTSTEFLGDLQQPEGWIRFSAEYDFGRDKTTAEAILGLSGKGPFGV